MLCPTTQSQVWLADAIQILDTEGSGLEPLFKNQNENEQNTLNRTIVWTGSPMPFEIQPIWQPDTFYPIEYPLDMDPTYKC